MRIYFYRTLHNIAARLGMDNLQSWCYRRWMISYMDKDPEYGYFDFAEDFIRNAYVEPINR